MGVGGLNCDGGGYKGLCVGRGDLILLGGGPPLHTANIKVVGGLVITKEFIQRHNKQHSRRHCSL